MANLLSRMPLELVLSRFGYQVTIPREEHQPARGVEGVLSLQYWAPHTIPGLLQSEDYARLVLSSQVPEPTRQELDRALDLLNDRHDLLAVQPGVELGFVIDEHVLHRVIGGEVHVMRAQLEYLLACSVELPNVSVQVLPSATHHLPGLVQPAMLVEGTERLVILEGHNGSEAIRQRESVAVFAKYFSALRAHALTPEESRDRIKHVLDKTSGQPPAA